VMQDYSTLNTWHWQPPGPPGNFRIEVDVRDSTRPVAYDQYTVIPFTINACSGATVSSSVPSPQPAGTQVTFTGSASASFCPNPLFEFWILAPGSTTWKIVQAYSTSATFTWNTGGLVAGTYLYTLWVRDASSSATLDAYFPGTAYTLTVQRCTGVTASASPASPQAAGTVVTLTAVGSGCANPRYQFWILPPGGKWTIVQAYSTGATFSWSTIHDPIGAYLYTVWVRDASSTANLDAYFPAATYTLTTQPCTSVTASAAPASPQAHGTAVTITAVASGCANPQYEFWMLAPGSTTWVIVQAYSSSATFNWSTTGDPAGTYYYTVWVRDFSSSAKLDAYFPGTAYKLT